MDERFPILATQSQSLFGLGCCGGKGCPLSSEMWSRRCTGDFHERLIFAHYQILVQIVERDIDDKGNEGILDTAYNWRGNSSRLLEIFQKVSSISSSPTRKPIGPDEHLKLEEMHSLMTSGVTTRSLHWYQ